MLVAFSTKLEKIISISEITIVPYIKEADGRGWIESVPAYYSRLSPDSTIYFPGELVGLGGENWLQLCTLDSRENGMRWKRRKLKEVNSS